VADEHGTARSSNRFFPRIKHIACDDRSEGDDRGHTTFRAISHEQRCVEDGGRDCNLFFGASLRTMHHRNGRRIRIDPHNVKSAGP
jgi:hypothetical protein